MTRSKMLDQLLLLLAAIAVIIGMLWLIDFMEKRAVSESIGFFVLANLLVLFGITWSGVVWFRRTPRLWMFRGAWIVVHAAIALVWAYLGRRVELGVLILALKPFVHYKIGMRRLRRLNDWRANA